MVDTTDPRNAFGALQQMMLDRMKTGEQQQTAQLSRMQQIAERKPEADEAERWAAMAQAASQVPPMVGGFGQLLASIGGAYGKTLAAQNQREVENQLALTKLYDQSSFGGSGVATQMAHALLNPIQNIGGVGVSRLGGETIVPKDYVDKAMAYFQQLEKRLQGEGNPNATQEAFAAATARYGDFLQNPSIAGSMYSQRPGNAPLPSQVASTKAQPTPAVNIAKVGSPDTLVPGEAARPTTMDSTAWLETLYRQRKEAVASEDFAKANELQQAIKAFETQGAAPVSNIPKTLSKAELEQNVTTAKETAKDLVDYEKNLTSANDASNAMLRNVGHLEAEAKKANFGAGAGAKTQILKWADTFGVTLDPSDREAMNANQIMGKIALQLATLGAKNISSRPTQLEFQKLLEEGVPATGMSREAFNRVLGLFKETAQSEQAQLSEFMKFKHSMPKGTVSAGDFSDYWSLRKDPRYATISIQDVLDTMKERKMTFNQVISKLRERK